MYTKEQIRNNVFSGHILDVLAKYPESVVDCIVTSPPYYSQRYYGKEINTIWDEVDPSCKHEWEYYAEMQVAEDVAGLTNSRKEDEEFTEGHTQAICKLCGAWYGQLGQEPTPMLYIKHLTDIFNGCRRILKPTGLLFLNLGDTYAGSHSGYGIKIPNPKSRQQPSQGFYAASVMKPPAATCVGSEEWIKPKQLMLIPSRLAISLQESGWTLRADIIWKKKSHLPNSALDNFDCSAYEHIFMFSKEQYYFFNRNKARKPYAEASIQRQKYKMTRLGGDSNGVKCVGADKSKENAIPVFIEPHSDGAVKTNIWEINTANSHFKHFAAYSEDLVKECILPGCSREVCTKCGAPKMEEYKMIVRDLEELSQSEKDKYRQIQLMQMDLDLKEKVLLKLLRKKVSLGFLQSCKCEDACFMPGVVFDPFMGSGTTAVVAKKLGYYYSGVEMQPKYIEIIDKRLREML